MQSCIIIFTYMITTIISFSHSLTTTTNNNNNIALFGDAFFLSKDNNHSVSLTQEIPSCRSSPSSSSSSTTTDFFPYSGNGVGRALYSKPIRFLDLTTNTTATTSFSTTFSFLITPSSPLCSVGDGLAFLISPEAAPDSSVKGQIGLPSPPDSFFAVEFDTSFDPIFADSVSDHVGVDIGSLVSAVSADIDLRGEREITAWVEYRAGATGGLVRVWISYSPEARPNVPVIAAEVDLSGVFGEFMYVGFSASNGHGSALHVVNMWKFKTFDHDHLSGDDDLFLPIHDFEGNADCFICPDGDDDPDSPPPLPSLTATTTMANSPRMEEKKQNKKKRNVIVVLLEDKVLGIGGFVALTVSILAGAGVMVVLAVKRKKKKKRRLSDPQVRSDNDNQQRVFPARLSLAEIWAATMGFDRSRIVGIGASATVYRGSLPPGDVVAVKRFCDENELASSSSNNIKNRTFNNEFAAMLGCLRHKNLIQLQGWCREGSETALVYEYMPNGSLDDALHNTSSSSSSSLTWRKRVDIVAGVASALAYLHEDCQTRIVHRDVKARNIMLDSDFTAKLGDFGLAQISGGGSRASSQAAAGTLGYLAPEYVCSGVATPETDVYSFGVVVLEVGTGRRAVESRDGDNGDGSVVDWVWGLWERGRLAEAVDPRLKGNAAGEREIERMLVVGLACVHPNPLKRPTARMALRILRREVPVPALPPRKPRLRLKTLVPNGFEEVPSLDDGLFMTPRSEFV